MLSGAIAASLFFGFVLCSAVLPTTVVATVVVSPSDILYLART